MPPEAKTTTRELRHFGLLLGLLFVAIFGVWPAVRARPIPLWPWIVGGVLVAAALLWPAALHYLHWASTRISLMLGWINTRIILTVLFGLSIIPAALISRLFGYDPLTRRIEPDRASYRVPSRARAARDMEHPY